ncbi:hypothetical protein T265_00728 [Opisthorchis viverrini]|uniref:Uncharacterized protein n=1 Tax=Opisthorchis viverrini TaxID=6198 RepID=A0A075AJI0_OPIVI|nr:hypothetical protein T265_00728 [Opisthorchis viverrini]KER33419.1 hypothetical protein T265_00728 [Opisthorchis viverrini]
MCVARVRANSGFFPTTLMPKPKDMVEFLLLAPTRASKSTSTVFSESPWTIRQSVICVASDAREFEFGTSFTLSYLFLGKFIGEIVKSTSIKEHVCPAGSYFLLKWLLLLLLIRNRHRVPGNCQPNKVEKFPHNMTSITSRISSCPPTLLLIGPVSCPIAGRLLRAAGHYAHPYWEHRSGRKLLPTALELDASGARRPTNKRRSQAGQGMTSGTKGTKCGQVWSPRDPASMAHCKSEH